MSGDQPATSGPAGGHRRVPTPLECRDLRVAYGGTVVLAGLDLSVLPDEVVAVLGPSGSGKTTLLNAVAGFIRPSGGEVLVAGRVVAAPDRMVPPERRGVGMVFQHYALWPHMTVRAIVAYPARRAGSSPAEAARRAGELLERMQISHLGDRRPAELSGGEQQRVGLARALARRAHLYLFDEPTAHLDSPLRAVFQEEVAERRRDAGAAAVYATHDAPEALALADRVALLRDGRIVHCSSPEEVYEQPADLWAARLTGPATVVRCPVRPLSPGRVEVTICGSAVEVDGGWGSANADGSWADGAPVLVRPEWAVLGEGPFEGSVTAVRYRGPHTDYAIETPAGTVDVRESGGPRRRRGERVRWRLERVWILAQESAIAGPG